MGLQREGLNLALSAANAGLALIQEMGITTYYNEAVQFCRDKVHLLQNVTIPAGRCEVSGDGIPACTTLLQSLSELLKGSFAQKGYSLRNK